MGHLFLWILLEVPAMEVVGICVVLFPLCSLWEQLRCFCAAWDQSWVGERV